MNEIKKRVGNLPVKLEDIQKYILIGQAKLKANLAAIRAIKDGAVEVSAAAVQAALADTQDLAEELLYAEAKMGRDIELQELKNVPRLQERTAAGAYKKGVFLPANVNKKQSHYAQELNRHQDAIAEVVAIARERGDVPVRKQVLKVIQANKPKPKTPALPTGKYNVIYADPPWEYRNSGLGGAAKQHYPTMSIEKLCEMAIAGIASDNAVLFMWTTNPLLAECMPVIEAWGFQYKTNICWVKQGRGTYGKLGFYVSGKHELLLICAKGSFLPEFLPPSVYESEKGKHSKKPDGIYGLIEKMYPKGKYLELFARATRNNWKSWGNEV